MSEPNNLNVIAGPALLYIAPVGTTPPPITGSSEWPIVWPVGWIPIGYTDSGVDFTYTPTLKSFTPDEESSPVYDILQAEKFEVAATLAEPLMSVYNSAISASAITTDAVNGVIDVNAGSLPLNYVAVGVQGPAPAQSSTTPAKGRMLIVQKAIAGSPISYKMQRKDVVKFAVKWEARKITGQNLFDLYEFGAAAS